MNHSTGFTTSEVGESKDDIESSSTSSDEDEEACELTEDIEKNFFRALSCLKKKDPQIYNKDARFFEKVPQIDENAVKEKRKKKTEKPLTLRAYEKSMLEGGKLLNEEGEYYEENSGEFPKNNKKSYVEEQKELKQSFKKVLDSDSEANDSENEIGGLFHEHSKSKVEKEKDEEDYRQWLKGQKNELNDKTTEGDMKFLHDYWNDPNLGQDEKYLRDYILNKRFLEKDDNDKADKLVTLEEDEEILNNQLEFEHKYNFRFEEPDQEFIKRYPRIMENSMRKKDNKRKSKREAVKKRKQEEKELKIKELRKLRASKHKEIEEKIKKIKEATGNEELGFKDEDIEKDFDPNEHDLQMQRLFSEEFYNGEENKKPVFTEDLDLDQYEDFEEGYDDGNTESNCVELDYGNEDFNMDCDYSPEKAALAKKKKLEAREKKKNKKKLTSATEAILLNQNVKKPVFDKNLHKTFQNYLDEYYSLDCEDFIEDMPCRFKYRKVVPNSFGLTVEEILAADDKELNKWCMLNKVYEIRPAEVEMYDVKAYEKKAKNEELKRKILPSLYKSDENDGGDENGAVSENKKKRKKKKKKNKSKLKSTVQGLPSEEKEMKGCTECKEIDDDVIKQEMVRDLCQDVEGILDSPSSSDKQIKNVKIKMDSDINLKRNADSSIDSHIRKKHKKDHNGAVNNECKKALFDETGTDSFHNKNLETSVNCNSSGKKKRKNAINGAHPKMKNPFNASKRLNRDVKKLDKNKMKGKNDRAAFYNDISDSRLKAYGIKPKKFKNKLKYGFVHN